MGTGRRTWPRARVALLAEGVDRNDTQPTIVPSTLASPSSRRAWIEINCKRLWAATSTVALLAEGVDRNCCVEAQHLDDLVALLAEGVDRNQFAPVVFWYGRVALLAEGVDRNGYQEAWAEYRMKSPSSRRAWIEMV